MTKTSKNIDNKLNNKLDTDLFDSKRSNIIEKNFYVIYNGNKIKNKNWENKVLEGINYKIPSKSRKNPMLDLNWQEIKHFFLKDVKRSLVLANILPSFLFLLIFLIVFRLKEINEKNGNFGFIFDDIEFKTIVLLISVILMVIAIILLVQAAFLKRRYIFRGNGRRSGYLMIKNSVYKELLEFMNEEIKKETISFNLIRTNRLIIRELEVKDAHNYYKFASNPNVNKYLMWENEKSIEEAYEIINIARENYKENKYFKLAICLKETNSFIGYIGLSTYDLSLKTCQVVYALDEEYWHKGYVKEALDAFIDYLINVQNKEIIYAGHVQENVNSGKVLLKCGFKRCESRDSSLVIHNEVKNITAYIYKR